MTDTNSNNAEARADARRLLQKAHENVNRWLYPRPDMSSLQPAR